MQSKNFEKVRKYYKNRLWDLKKVHDAVGRWITAEEFKTITGEEYVVEE